MYGGPEVHTFYVQDYCHFRLEAQASRFLIAVSSRLGQFEVRAIAIRGWSNCNSRLEQLQFEVTVRAIQLRHQRYYCK